MRSAEQRPAPRDRRRRSPRRTRPERSGARAPSRPASRARGLAVMRAPTLGAPADRRASRAALGRPVASRAVPRSACSASAPSLVLAARSAPGARSRARGRDRRPRLAGSVPCSGLHERQRSGTRRLSLAASRPRAGSAQVLGWCSSGLARPSTAHRPARRQRVEARSRRRRPPRGRPRAPPASTPQRPQPVPCRPGHARRVRPERRHPDRRPAVGQLAACKR